MYVSYQKATALPMQAASLHTKMFRLSGLSGCSTCGMGAPTVDGDSGSSGSSGSSASIWGSVAQGVTKGLTSSSSGSSSGTKAAATNTGSNWLDSQSNTTLAIGGVAALALLLAVAR